MELSAALLFAIGFFGSVHCVGMCGSIAGALALSLPAECRQNSGCLARYLAAYNLGRVVSYSVVGGLGGLIGSALTGVLFFPAVHELFQILASAVLIAVGLYLTGWLPQLRQFGLGTLPAIATAGSAAGWLAGLARNRYWQQADGLVLVAAGVLGLLFGESTP